MKKYILAFFITIPIPIMLFVRDMGDTTEEPPITFNSSIEESANKQTDILSEPYDRGMIKPEETEATDEKSDIVSADSDKNFYKVSDIKNGQGSIEQIGDEEYRVTLYDKNHNEVFSEDYSYMRMPPWFTMITDNIWEIGISVGSPARYTFYFDTETAEISDVYFNAKVFGDKYIAYMDFDVISEDEITLTLTLTDIFDKGILHQEVVRDFSVCADPMSAVHSVEMIDDNSIRLEYCEGEDYTTVSETIELEWTPVFNDEPITVVVRETKYYSGGSIGRWSECEYSDVGSLTKEICHNEDGTIHEWYEYEYDSAGKQIKQTQYYEDGNVYGWDESEYDSAGNVVKSISYDADGNIRYWYEYEYDGTGNLIKEIYYNADGGINWWWENEYDSAGNQVKYIYHDEAGNIRYWYEYEYDSAGNREKYTLYNADGSVKYWFEYKYDSAGNEVKNIEYSPSGSLLYWYEYEYDGVGNQVRYILYDADDNISHWYEYEYITIMPHSEVTVSN